MLPGFATAEGTARYRRRFPELDQAGHFRCRNLPGGDLRLSSIGLGTYLGEPDEECDASYVRAISAALRSGVNVLDSAINYRHQRSERNIGQALRELTASGALARDEVIVCTKAGYLPLDGVMPEDPREYLKREYVESGILDPKDIAGANCITPRYIADQLERSRRNLGLETIDVFYLHNPEAQLDRFERDFFRQRLGETFAMLEQAVKDGKIRYYGLATWSGVRMGDTQPAYISLFDTLEIARDAGGEQHHLRFVQLPLNLAMPEGFTNRNQVWARQRMPVLEWVQRAGVVAVGSASLMQGQLTWNLSQEIMDHFRAETDTEAAIQFARSAPGITTSLVGMAREEHVAANLAVARKAVIEETQWRKLFQGSS